MNYKGVIAANKRRATHGMHKSREYGAWRQMKQRCSNPKNRRYHRYGGRGISVCAAWDSSFAQFYADMGPAPIGHTLDRIDNNGNYEPANCRWATSQQQQNNTVSNLLITHDGRTMTVAEWSKELEIPYHWIRYRMKQGWVPPKLFSKENLQGTTRQYEDMYEGEMLPLKEIAKRSGTPLATLYYRLKRS